MTPATLSAWNEQVQRSRARLAREVCSSPEGFLSANIESERSNQAGHAPDLGFRSPQGKMAAAPSGLIHHWTGAIFIRNARPSDVVAVLEDYDSYMDIFRPAVIDSRLLSRTQDQFSYQLKLAQKGFGVKTGLLGVFRSSYYQLSSDAGYSITEATALGELGNPGTPEERLVPFSASHG